MQIKQCCTKPRLSTWKICQQTKEEISNCQSIPDKEEGLGRACPVHFSEIYHLLKDTGSLEKKGKSVILIELSSHEIKYEWRNIHFTETLQFLKQARWRQRGLGTGWTIYWASYFPDSVVSVLNTIIYFIEAQRLVFNFLSLVIDEENESQGNYMTPPRLDYK